MAKNLELMESWTEEETRRGLGKNDFWGTRKEDFLMFQECVAEFELDAATSADNRLNTPKFYTPADNGLSRPWAESTFCNMPFSNGLPWLEKAIKEYGEMPFGAGNILLLGIAGLVHNKTTSRIVNQFDLIVNLGRMRFEATPEIIAERESKGLRTDPTSPMYDIVGLYLGSWAIDVAKRFERYGYYCQTPVRFK